MDIRAKKRFELPMLRGGDAGSSIVILSVEVVKDAALRLGVMYAVGGGKSATCCMLEGEGAYPWLSNIYSYIANRVEMMMIHQRY